MGTTARQKLLQLRLAAHANNKEANHEDKIRIESHIADLNKMELGVGLSIEAILDLSELKSTMKIQNL